MDPSMCKKDTPSNIKIPFGGKPIHYPSEMNTHLDNLIKHFKKNNKIKKKSTKKKRKSKTKKSKGGRKSKRKLKKTKKKK